MQALGHFGKWILLCRRNCTKEGNSVRNIHLQRTALLRQLGTSTKNSFLILQGHQQLFSLCPIFRILFCDIPGDTHNLALPKTWIEKQVMEFVSVNINICNIIYIKFYSNTLFFRDVRINFNLNKILFLICMNKSFIRI